MHDIANQHDSFAAGNSRRSIVAATLITVMLATCLAVLILSNSKLALLAIGFAPLIIYTYARRPGIFLFLSTMPYMATQLVFRELEIISAASAYPSASVAPLRSCAGSLLTPDSRCSARTVGIDEKPIM